MLGRPLVALARGAGSSMAARSACGGSARLWLWAACVWRVGCTERTNEFKGARMRWPMECAGNAFVLESVGSVASHV